MGVITNLIKGLLKDKPQFIIGDTYEMRGDFAVALEESMGVTFDKKDYKFTCHGIHSGMVWSRDIHYNKKINGNMPPPPHPTWGSPLASHANKYIREATSD